MRRTLLMLGSMALVGALWGALLLISGLGQQAAEAQTATTPPSGTVTAWGNNSYSESSVPAGLSDVKAISGGYGHSLALKNDGTVVAWGNNQYGQSSVPAGLSGVTAISAGSDHSLALKNDGTVVAWGRNDWGQSSVPAGLSDVKAISTNYLHSLALKNDGTVVAWGRNDYGQSNVPAGLSGVTAISAGGNHSLALKDDGTVVAWGNNSLGESSVPAGLSDVKAISGGLAHSLALKNDGTVVAWGFNNFGQTDVPAGLSGVTAIDGGAYHSLALKDDGTVVAWGWNGYGQSSVPAGLSGVTAISGGGFHSLALVSAVADNTPPTLSVSHTPDGTNGWNKTSPVTLTVSASDSGSGLAADPTCTDGSTALTLTAGSTAGSWTASVSGEGTHNISCSVSDKATNTSSPTTDTVKIDKTAPTVIGLQPAATATGVSRGTNVAATFSEKMDPLSITNSTFKLFKVKPDGSTTQITNVRVSLSTDGLTAKLNPFGTSSTLLAANTKYKGVITTGAKDEAGNQLDQDPTTAGLQQKGWTFTTKG